MQRFSLLFRVLAASALLGVLTACSTAPPAGVAVVTPFDAKRYAGDWYEIARLDHSFERGLSHVTARYEPQADGSIRVINRGYDTKKQKWQEAVGRARFVGDSNRGSLKVSFFGPFYGGYHVVALDQEGYRWSMVAGPDRDYLWILAREPRLPDEVRQTLLRQATALGYEVQKLIWVEHRGKPAAEGR